MASVNTIHYLVRREQYMLNQFCSNLQIKIAYLVNNGHQASEALTALSARLDGEVSWALANQVELALVEYYDDTMLATEWERRSAEVHKLSDNLQQFYQGHASEEKPEKLRTLLHRLVSDLQWKSETKRVIRFNESQMRRKIVLVFLCAFVLFFSSTIMRVLFGYEFDNLRLYYIFTASISGLLGAAFSQLISIQSRVEAATLDQVRAMGQIGYIIARAMVGAGAGLIMFYLMQSGLLSGAFFPEFIHSVDEVAGFMNDLGRSAEQIAANTQGTSQSIESSLAVGTLARPAQGLSLFIVWCLIAGFSEKLIPGILASKANDAEASAKKQGE